MPMVDSCEASRTMFTTKKDALAQQEHVQLKRKKQNAGGSAVVVKPVSLILLSIAAIFLVSVLATLRFVAMNLTEDSSSSSSASRQIQKPTLTKVLRASNTNNNGSTQTTTIPPVRTYDDMDIVFREYHKHPKLGATAVFAGTSACLAKEQSNAPCRLILPMDTADQTAPAAAVQQQHSLDNNFALRTWKGQKSVIGVDKNQDRSIMVLFDSQTFGKSSLLLLADGHGETGHVIAEEVIKDLPLRILKAIEAAKNPSDETTIRQVLKTTILETDQMLLDEIEEDGGATLVLILHMGDKLYLASAGDSTATVMEWNNNNNNGLLKQATELRTAVRHKPMDPEERTRIEAAGGQVIQNFGDPSSRVIVPSPKGRMFDMALAMSRCMGDRDGKIAGLLTAEPSVVVLDLNAHAGAQLFVIVSSDGVTDMFPLRQLAAKIGAALFPNKNGNKKRKSILETAVDGSLQQSSSVWLSRDQPYRDDMTLMVAQVAA